MAAALAPMAAALVVVVLLLPVPAVAYPILQGGFESGQDTVQVTFGPSETERTGPSLTLLTNSTVTSASLKVGGLSATLNTTENETTDIDFSSNQLATNLNLSGGNITLAHGSEARVLNATNLFGQAALAALRIDAGSLVLDNATSGNFVTDNISAPPAGWGTLTAQGYRGTGGTFRVDILTPAGSLLAANVSIGALLSINATLNPSVRVRGLFTAPTAADSPRLASVSIGQVAGDSMLSSGPVRVLSNIRNDSDGLTLHGANANYVRYSANPVLPAQASTYRSNYINYATFFQAGSTWHMYAGVTSANTDAGMQIAHATSTDLVNWTWDATPVLSPVPSTWEDHKVDHPWVIENPVSTNPRYLMYYSGWGSPTQFSSGLATSNDLYNWTKYSGNPILTPSSTGWDTWNSGNPRVIYEGGTWRMWYAGANVTTGGGNSMGYATSTDGYNWTKYGSQPVLGLNTTAGSIDRDDLQFKSIRKWNGAYYAFFGCITTGGVYHACLATSADGISWTLFPQYVLNPSGSTWESWHLQPTDFMVNDGRFILWYAGCNSDCSLQQLGRADALIVPGSVSVRVDLGVGGPRSFSSIRLNASSPATGTTSLTLRSSNDGITYSAPETIGPSGLIVTTPARRYIQWIFQMGALPGTAPPKYMGAELTYTAYLPQGRYESSEFAYPENVVSASVTLGVATPASTVVGAFISNDGGVTWTPAPLGASIPFAAPSPTLRYALDFAGTVGQSPLVGHVALTVERIGFPADVSLRLGVNGTPFAYLGGALMVEANVSIPAAALNLVIEAARVATPAAATVAVPIIVTSSHYGVVQLSEPRVLVNLRNPLTANFSPAGDSVVVLEGAAATFAAETTSYPPEVPVNTSWSLDGAEQLAWRGALAFTFSPDYNQAGPHTVSCTVENGDFWFERTWNVSVTNVNRPPALRSQSPAPSVSVSHTSTLLLSVEADDPDRDTLVYVWELDGAAFPPQSSEMTLSPLDVGPHTVSVTVSDGADSVSASWQVTSTDAPPTLVASPSGALQVSHTGAVTLAVVALDADGDSLSYEWSVDGTLAASATTASYILSSPAVGTHQVSVVVRAAGLFATHLWSVESTNAAPTLQSKQPTGNVTVASGASASFEVEVTDGDGDPITYTWKVNGHAVAGALPNFTLPTDLEPGNHAVQCVASDGSGETTGAVWNVTVEAPPPRPPPSTPGAEAWAAAAAMLAASAVALRRRRSQ